MNSLLLHEQPPANALKWDMYNINYQNVIDVLLEAVPELARDQEVIDLKNECGPHVVFGELTHFVINQYRCGNVGEGSAFQRIMCFLDACLKSADIEVVNLVEVSFIENLHAAGGDYQGLKSKLTRDLKRELEAKDGKNPIF